jgi:MFS family permease
MQAHAEVHSVSQEEKIWTRDFILICLANFFIFLSFQMALPTIPLFIEYLGESEQFIGIITGIFTFSALIIRPYAGSALETKGRKFIYMLGVTIFTFAVGVFALIYSIFILIILRFIQGLGWGFATTASGTIATDLIPPKRRGEGLGYFGLSGNLALALGPSLGLTLANYLSFTQLFIICGILGIISLLLASQVRYKQVNQTPKVQQLKNKRFDIFEKSAIEPSLLLFFLTATLGGISTFLPLYTLQKDIGGIEWYFLIYAVFLFISRTFSGRIYDRKGHKAIFLPGTILVLIAMLLLAWLPNSITLLIAAAIYGLGFGSVQPALQAWAVEKAPNNRKGMANATFFSFFDLGVGAGALAFGQIAYMFSYSAIYIVAACSVLSSVALYLYLLMKEKNKKKLVQNS